MQVNIQLHSLLLQSRIFGKLLLYDCKFLFMSVDQQNTYFFVDKASAAFVYNVSNKKSGFYV